MKLISNEEDYGKTPIEQWLTAFYTGRNVEKLVPDGVLYRFHLSHNDLDGLACHVVSTIYDCILNCFEIPMVMVDATEALRYKDWDQIHNAHNRMPIRHAICEAGAKNVKEALHHIFRSLLSVGPNDQIILLITDLGGLNDSMFDEFYEKFGDRFQVIVVDHHLTTTVPERGKCDPNQIFWYVTGYKEDNLQSATKNLFTATYDPYDSVHASSVASYFASEKYKTFMKQLTEYVDAVSMYDTGRWGEWLDGNTPNDVDLSVQHQLYFNHLAWDTASVFHYRLILSYINDIIHLLCTEDYVHTNLQYWEIISGNLNKLHKEYTDIRSMVLAHNPHVTLTLKIGPINDVYNPATRHMIQLGDISADVHPINNLILKLSPLVTFGIIELSKDRRQTREWKYFSLCSREIMKKYKLDLLILVDEPNGTVSLRSMDNHGFEINCADIASRNGGGGHKRAAGYPIPKVAEVLEDHPERYSQFPGVIPYSVTMQKRTETLLYTVSPFFKEDDTDVEEDEDDTDADDWEDETEEAEEDGTEEAETTDASEDSEEEDSDEELIPIVDRNRVIRWAGINWKPLQQDDDLLFLTPCEPVGDVKLCTFRELGDVAAEWGAKHLSKTNQSMLVPIYPYGITCTIAPITLEHILNIPDARNANRAQISMPYGNVPYWTGSSAYNGSDTDDMVWCMNEKGQNVPVNKDAFLAFRPMICLHITDALVNSLDDGKSTVLMPNIPNAYPSIGKHVYWAGNDWIVTHVDPKMVYMTLADVVPDWKIAWDELQDTCYAWAKKTFSAEEMKKLVPIACGITRGKVWVASKQLIGTGLAYFADNEHRAASNHYWTSTEYSSVSAWNIDADGDLYNLNGIKTSQKGFRPSICMLRSNFGPVDLADDRSEEAELYNSCRTLIATGMRVMWANQEWIVSNIKPDIVMLTLAHAIPDLMGWDDLQDACNAWGNQYLAEKKQQLVYLTVGELCGKVFVATKLNMDGGFDYFKDDDRRYLGECYWTSTKDANGRTYYVDKTGKIQSVSGQEMCSDIAPKFAFRPTVAIWTKEFCNDSGVTVVGE